MHRIESRRELTGGEGAYAVNSDFYEENDAVREAGMQMQADGDRARAFFPWGCSGIVNLEGERDGLMVAAHPNTNIMYSRTVIPTLKGKIGVGETWLACAVLGTKSRDEGDLEWSRVPEYERSGSIFRISYGNCVREYSEAEE